MTESITNILSRSQRGVGGELVARAIPVANLISHNTVTDTVGLGELERGSGGKEEREGGAEPATTSATAITPRKRRTSRQVDVVASRLTSTLGRS